MRVFPGKASLIRPPLDTSYDLGGGRIANERREMVEHANHWKPWIAGGVDVHVGPGDHDSMVLEPSVRVLAAKVRAALEDAQREKPEESEAA